MSSLGCAIRKVQMSAGELGRDIQRTGEKIQRETYFASCDIDRGVKKVVDKLRF